MIWESITDKNLKGTNDCAIFVSSNTKATQNIQNKTRYPILDILFIVKYYSGGDDGVRTRDLQIDNLTR